MAGDEEGRAYQVIMGIGVAIAFTALWAAGLLAN